VYTCTMYIYVRMLYVLYDVSILLVLLACVFVLNITCCIWWYCMIHAWLTWHSLQPFIVLSYKFMHDGRQRDIELQYIHTVCCMYRRMLNIAYQHQHKIAFNLDFIFRFFWFSKIRFITTVTGMYAYIFFLWTIKKCTICTHTFRYSMYIYEII
jgi:hypothetical protein